MRTADRWTGRSLQLLLLLCPNCRFRGPIPLLTPSFACRSSHNHHRSQSYRSARKTIALPHRGSVYMVFLSHCGRYRSRSKQVSFGQSACGGSTRAIKLNAALLFSHVASLIDFDRQSRMGVCRRDRFFATEGQDCGYRSGWRGLPWPCIQHHYVSGTLNQRL